MQKNNKCKKYTDLINDGQFTFTTFLLNDKILSGIYLKRELFTDLREILNLNCSNLK